MPIVWRGEMDEAFERFGPVRWALKRIITDPLANYMPASWMRGLRFGKSELAASNWIDPGGWRTMVISYHGNPQQWADKILVGGGAVSMALRNRLRLASRLLAELIDASAASSVAAGTSPAPPVDVLCLGAGPGQIVLRAMQRAQAISRATLVDINRDAFDYGKNIAESYGLAQRVNFICGDARDVKIYLSQPPAIVKMIGLCEHLTDQMIVDIASAVAAVMPAGSPIIFNNITRRHGNDRFLRRIFNLHMNYRPIEQMTDLMRRAGFDNFEIHSEPLGVYNVIIGRRAATGVAPGSGPATTAALPTGLKETLNNG